MEKPKTERVQNSVLSIILHSELAEGKCAKLMALRPSRWALRDSKAINLDFWAAFLCYLSFAAKRK